MRFIHGPLRVVALVSIFIASFARSIPISNDITADKIEVAKLEKRVNIIPPTVDQCTSQLNVPRDTTVFYSGGPDFYQKAIEAVNNRRYLKGYQIMAQKWKDPDWLEAWQVDPELSKRFWDVCSEALAMATSGTAYVLLPTGTGISWNDGTVWDRKEWPNIPEGVTVIRINPDDPREREVIKF
ncbi:hypothetical protein F5Y13DRAFT_189527 [Hypoxylon sp. FL1857]|nr:hypothetical protein F5Y13DRAFT_189527 [Hypoxylon sp. FL1857]